MAMCTSRPVNQSKNIKKVATRLSEDVGSTCAKFFEVANRI